MDLGYTVRPVICRTDDDTLTHGFFGSGFLIMSTRGFPYFITALHVLTNHGREPSDLQVPYALGAHEPLPFGQPFNARVEDAPNLADLLALPIPAQFVLEKEIWKNLYPLRPTDTNSKVGDTAVVIGFPHDYQEVFYEDNRGEYVPTSMTCTISNITEEEQVLELSTPSEVELTTFDLFSGSPVYAFRDPKVAYLAGVVLQGGREANRLFALSSRILYNLIEIHERNNAAEP